jgi:hypothetical protein
MITWPSMPAGRPDGMCGWATRNDIGMQNVSSSLPLSSVFSSPTSKPAGLDAYSARGSECVGRRTTHPLTR